MQRPGFTFLPWLPVCVGFFSCFLERWTKETRFPAALLLLVLLLDSMRMKVFGAMTLAQILQSPSGCLSDLTSATGFSGGPLVINISVLPTESQWKCKSGSFPFFFVTQVDRIFCTSIVVEMVSKVNVLNADDIQARSHLWSHWDLETWEYWTVTAACSSEI